VATTSTSDRPVSDVVSRLTATVDYLRVSVGPPPPGESWLACGPLVGDPEHLLGVVRPTAGERGTDADDVAMSLFVQGYSFRIASVAIGGWLLSEVVVDVDPARTSIAMGRGRPNAVRLDAAALVGAEDAPVGTLHDVLIDGHLARLVDTAHRACRIGEALLWGNVGASCAASFGAFMDPLADRRVEIRERVRSFFVTARPEVARSGRVVPVGSRWAWERNACCLWYQTAAAFRCQDCSLWSAKEREARYEAMRAEEREARHEVMRAEEEA
jgi:ferric iron reductase protein FhuF